MRSLHVLASLTCVVAINAFAKAQLTPVSAQMHGEAHATLTPPIGPPQTQTDIDDMDIMGDLNSFVQIGSSTTGGPYATGRGVASLKVFGTGYRVASSGFAFGRNGLGNTVDADGSADAAFIFNITQACTIDLSMTFLIDLPDLPGTGTALTMFEFRGPGNSLIYNLSLNQPTGNALHIDQSFNLLPGQYQMIAQSMADVQIPAFGTSTTGSTGATIIDFTVPSPGGFFVFVGMTLLSRRRRTMLTSAT